MVSNRKGKIILSAAIVVVIAIAGLVVFLIYQGSNYLSTDNARVAAPLIGVSSVGGCQVLDLKVDIGSYVKKGQVVASVGMPRGTDTALREGMRASPLGNVSIESPVNGYVAAVWSYPGALIGAGQPIVTVYDTSNVWVQANIEETKINRIKPGQKVKITVDSLGGKTVTGSVDGIAPATAGTFSLLSQSNTSGNFTKVVQVVPIKISLDGFESGLLIPGSSVEVEIETR
ncbi:MAG: hypothetical protein A2Z02_06340 [Chloroflexi bacterium RBG_16_48_7]|nr:MAG: hypothetical protein A2Z02_06340 [Chloroflexi bacterium RBG_16_48_7]